MKALTTPSGNFGPFKSIEVLEDRYRCDNTDLPFSVIGQGEIVEADTVTWPAPPAPPIHIPTAVTMRQARLALLAAGLLPSVDAAIAALPEPQKSAAKIEWEYSQEVQRHNGFVSVLAPALGLSDAQIDALFVAAQTL